MTPTGQVALAGATAGAGVLLCVRELLPTRPDLAAAVALLRTPPAAARGPHPDAPATGALLRTGGWVAARLPATITRRTPAAADLAVLDRTAGEHLARKTVLAAFGLALPPVTVAILALAGIALPWPVPALAGPALAVGLFLLADALLAGEADTARAEVRSAVAAYLELVALERLADGGPAQSLERAATAGAGPTFTRLATTLAHTRLSGGTPWAALAELGARLGVDDLIDLGEIVSLAGDDGAAIGVTLTAKSTALRARALTDTQAAANAASEKLTLPGVLLGLGFLILVSYPALAGVLATT